MKTALVVEASASAADLLTSRAQRQYGNTWGAA